MKLNIILHLLDASSHLYMRFRLSVRHVPRLRNDLKVKLSEGNDLKVIHAEGNDLRVILSVK